MLNSTGELLWTQDIGGKVNSSPAIAKNRTIYIGASDGSLYALSHDGDIQWSYSTQGEVESSPAIGANGTVYVGSKDGTIYAVSKDGSKEWSYSTNNTIVSSPAIGANNTIYIGSQDGSLYALSQEGNEIWSYSTNSEINSSPVIGENGTIYVGAKNGRLYAISQKGNKVWSYSTGGEIESSPAISANGDIYFGSRNGKLYALSPQGKKLNAFQTGGDISSSPCIAKDGTIYIGSGDGKLYALENGVSGLYRSKWPMFGNKRYHNGIVDLNSPEITNIEKVDDPPYKTVTWSWNASEAALYRHAVTQNATHEFTQRTFNSTNELTLQSKHGEWYVHVQPVDMSGNLGDPCKVSVFLDNIPPEAGLSGTPEKVTNSTSLSINVSGDEVTHYKYRLASSQYSQSFSVNTTIHLTDLDDGFHELEVKGRDAAGNWQTNPTNASWTIDTTPPSPTQLKLNSSRWPISDEHVVLNAAVSELALRFQESGSGLDLSASRLELVDGENQKVPGSWQISQGDVDESNLDLDESNLVGSDWWYVAKSGYWEGQAIYFKYLGYQNSGDFDWFAEKPYADTNGGAAWSISVYANERYWVSKFAKRPDSHAESRTVPDTVPAWRPIHPSLDGYESLPDSTGHIIKPNDFMVFTPDDPLPESVYTLNIRLRDKLGNAMAKQSTSFFVDTTPPPAPEPDPVTSPTHQATQVISGSKAVDASVELNGTQIVGHTEQTSWSHEVSLSPGENELVLTSRDRAGNLSPNATLRIVFNDIAPPEVACLSVNGELDGTAAELDWSGFDESQHGDIAKYQVFVRENEFSQVQGMSPTAELSLGTRTYTASGLSRGETYYFAVVAVDQTGNMRNEVSPVSAAISDASPPNRVRNFQADSGRTSLSFTWDPPSGEEPEGYHLYWDGSASPESLPANRTSWEQTGLDPASGYTLRVAAVDAAGNEGQKRESTAATWLDNPESISAEGYDGYAELSWSGVQAGNLLRHYAVYASRSPFDSVQGMSPETTSSSPSAKVAGLENNATYHFAAVSVNISGGRSPQVNTTTATPEQDREGPEISGLEYAGTPLDQAQPLSESGAFRVTAEDPSGVSRVAFAVDGDNLVSDHSPPYRVELDLSEISDGEHSLEIEAVDSLGNTATRSHTFQVALAPPDAPQITFPSSGAVTNQPELRLEGSSEPGCEIRAYTNGTLAGNATVSEQGTFALRIGLVEGTNRLTARAVNRGGTSDPSQAVEVTLNTAVPSPPRGLSATPQKQGEVGLSWQRPPDTERIAGYLVYRSDSEFSDPAQAEKVTADPIQEASYTDMPPEDGSYYYRVVCLNQAGTTSQPSDSALAQSDGTSPRALAVEYEPQGEQDPDTGAVAPGRVEVTLRLSEPVAVRPFLSLTPEGGTPISVDLSSQGERTYSGSLQVKNSTPSGPAWATFSARDEAGNRGTNIEAGKKLLLDTDGPALARIALDPSAPIENSQSDPRTVTVVLGLDEAVAPDATPWLAYSLSGSPGDPTRITGLERIGSQGADAQTWRAELTLPAEAGLDSAQTLSFAYEARDHLGNVCSRIEADNAYQVYQGDLPPLRAPEGFSGTPRPGGRIELAWEAVPNCAGYRVYRQAPNQGQMTPRSDLIPSDQTQYTDQTQSDMEYTYAVVSVRQENGQESESGLSRKITLTSDSLAPGAPTDLTLDLAGNGVRAAWSAPNATGELTYNLYRADASSIDSVSGLDPLIAGIPHRDPPRVVDTEPSATEHCYAVTAVDEAGNESPPSDSAYLNQDLMPVSSLRVEKKGDQSPVLSWEHPGGDIAGYNVYLGDDSNSTQLNQSPLQQKSFTDSGYSGDRRTYSVVAVDDTGRGSPARGITLPRVEAELSSGAPLRRNLMNRLVYRVKNRAQQKLDNVRLLVEAGGRSHRSETFDLASGSSREMPVTVGGYKQLNATAQLTETVEIRPAPGRLVRLRDSRSVQVAPGSLSLSVSTGRFLQGGNGTARLELANPGGGPVEVVTSSGTGSQRGIRFLLQDSEGNVLDVARLGQKLGDKIVSLPCGDAVARIPAEGSYTSQQVTLSVPASLSGDELRVQARIPHVYHHRGKGDQVVMQGIRADNRVSLARTSYSGKVTQVCPKQSSGNQSITIRGRAKDRSSGQALAGAELILSINNQGYERERSVRTNSTGWFSHEFTPLEGESGLYKVCAVHPDLTARPVQERFVISRVSYQPSRVDLSLPKNKEKIFSVRVETGQGTEVDNLGLKYLPQDQPDGSLPEGVHVEPGDPVDLSGGSSARLPLTFWADNAAAEETSLVLRLASDNATWGTIPVQASFSQALPVLDFEPSHIETGVTHNATANERITLENSGLAPLKDLELSLLQTDGSEAPSWARLTGTSSQQEIPVGGSQSIGVAFSPDSNVDQGRHHFLLRVSGSNLDPVDIHCYATVARSGEGDAIFKVTDMYTGTKNDEGELIQGVNGAEVELQNEKVQSILKEKETDGLGEAVFSDLPAGRYRYRVSASNHDAQTGRVWIKPGVTAAKEVFLPTSMVTVHWDVEETTIEDEYEIVLTAEYETDVPAPVVVMEPASTSLPSMEAGEVFRGEINLVNKGKIRAENVTAELPSGGDHFRYEMLGEVPDTLAAGERVSLPYKVTCQQPLEQSGSGSGGGDCGSYMRCMTVGYEWVCANGEWSKQAVKHCWTHVYGDCSGSGSGSPPINIGGGGDSASWGGGAGGGGSSSPVPEPDDLDGAECIPEPPSDPGCPDDDKCKDTERGRCCETGSGVDLLRGEYQLPGKVDLAVKVAGGKVKMQRDYYQGRWYFPHNYTLRYTPPHNELNEIHASRNVEGSKSAGSGGDGGYNYQYIDMSLYNKCVRAGVDYQGRYTVSDPKSMDKSTLIFKNNHNRIEVTDVSKHQDKDSLHNRWEYEIEGLRWKNGDGDWEQYKRMHRNDIHFSQQFRLESYGNQKGIVGRLVYADANATRPVGINDRHGNRVLSFEYGADDTLDRAYSPDGRQVRYIHEQGRLSKVVGPLGNATQYEYNDNGRISRVEYPQGKVREIAYSSFGNRNLVSRVTDSKGRSFNYDYSFDEASREYYAMAEFPSGKVKEVWFDSDGDVRRVDINGETVKTIEKDGRDLLITDERGLTTRKEYNEWNNLTRIEYPDGSTVKYEYDNELHRVTRKVNERGVVTEYEYDSQGNRIRKIEAAGTVSERITEYAYDGSGNRIEIVRPGGAVVSMEYDERGNMIRRTGPEGGVTKFTYDETGNLLKKEAPEGRTWEYEYDDRGRRIRKVDPKGRITKYEYDAFGNKVKRVGPGGRVTRFEYDAEGNLVKRIREGDPETESDNLVARFEYNAAGKVIRKVGPGGRQVRFEYDKRSRKKRTIKAGNVIVRHYSSSISGCSSCGGPSDKPSRIEYPTYSVEYAYDKLGRKTVERKMVNGTTLTTQYEYDASGNLVSKTDPKGRITEKSYDPLGRVSQKTDPAGGVTEYEYNARGNLIRLTDPKGQTTRFEYDLKDQLVKKIRPMGESTTYSYDEAGNLVEKIDPEGQRTVYEYNTAGELTGVKHYASSGATTPEKTVSLSYDEAGHLVSYDDGTTSGSYSYDAFGRRTNSTVDYGPFQLSHGTTYTESGRRKSLTYPDGSTYEYSYNEANRLQSMDLPDSGQITWSEYEWRRPTKVHLPGGASKNFDLDPLQRIKEITSSDPAGNTILHRKYDYDQAGNIISEKTGEGRHDYDYDPLDRLTKAENPALPDEEYSYDAVGNRLTSADTNGTWSYNANNELLSYNNATCSFDDNGNMVKRVVHGQETRYIYNANNRLVRVEDGSGDVIAEYYYDPFGRRLWKEVNGERTYFHYCEQGLIAEYDDQGDPIRFYGYKPGSSWTTDPLFLRKDGSYYFYHNDHLGTPQKLTARNGRVVWSTRYASFGGTQLVAQEIKNPLRFPGQYYDRETGLHYNYHRYYDPQVGRYLREDPLLFLGGNINLYTYCNNNSFINSDSYGLIIGAKGAAVGAIGGAITGAYAGAQEGGVWGALAGATAGAASGAIAGFAGDFIAGGLGGGIIGTAVGQTAGAIVGEMLSPSKTHDKTLPCEDPDNEKRD
ncbi:MAG: PQQ-binding-like beta-propeller repeat protein [Desulfohalobiaceae bacterium]|nr:PQQ-binding-like beta-propeller repeat protein [Desulfohalobiaceae bacterium]